MDDKNLLDDVFTADSKSINDYQLASKAQRFGNYFVDAIALFIVQSGISFVLTLGENPYAGIAINLMVTIFYLPFMESQYGQTLGKMATGTKVINENMEKPTFGQAFLRALSRLVPFEAFSILFSSNGRGWHDKWTNTYVVRK